MGSYEFLGMSHSVSQTPLFSEEKIKEGPTEENPIFSSYMVRNVLEFQPWDFRLVDLDFGQLCIWRMFYVRPPNHSFIIPLCRLGLLLKVKMLSS